MSLTTVFGMGTGVPSSQKTPTIFSFKEKTFVNITHQLCYVKKKLVTRGRIELPFTAWEAVVLAAWPTGHFHTPYVIGVQKEVVHHRGLEPRTHWLRVSCSTNWANGAFLNFFLWVVFVLHPQNWTTMNSTEAFSEFTQIIIQVKPSTY